MLIIIASVSNNVDTAVMRSMCTYVRTYVRFIITRSHYATQPFRHCGIYIFTFRLFIATATDVICNQSYFRYAYVFYAY